MPRLQRKKLPRNAPPYAVALTKLLDERGLSLKDAADRSGLSRATIGFIAAGQYEPKWSTILALAKGLGVSVEAFFPSENE